MSLFSPTFFILTGLLATAVAEPVISEFMAANQTTAADEDGTFSDWIEIHNPDQSPISLVDWCLTDSATSLTKWRFPNVTLSPGEFRIVWASGKNRRNPTSALHTNFSLSAGGEFLALVRPDGTTIEQQYAPAYPPQAADESYGAIFQSTVLLAPGAETRYRVPVSSSDPAPGWNQTSFADTTWSSGNSGLGYGITVPGITVRHIFKNGSIGGLSDAISLVAEPAGSPLILSEATLVTPTVNFLGDGNEGRFGNSAIPPGGSGDHFAMRATGFVHIPTAGNYTFGANSDDGVRIKIDSTVIVNDATAHAVQDNYGTINLSAGLHAFEVITWDGGGGDALEFFAAPGTFNSWSATAFKLVGDATNGGLAAGTLLESTSDIFQTNLATELSGMTGGFFRNTFSFAGAAGVSAMSLVTRHNDGFVAWLNGVKVASDNAPETPLWDSTATATRTDAQSLRPMGFNLTAFLPLLQNGGSNLLAIQGMKQSATDTGFLILPELIVGSIDPPQGLAFYANGKSTPGWINGTPSWLGKVEDTQFSIPRGFFTSPFELSITCATPGATILYTTDGSTPAVGNGTVYTGPITISSTTTLRAIGTRMNWDPTNVDTQTYLFPDDLIRQSSPPPGWPATSGTAQELDYGMDPDIVDHSNPDVGSPSSVKAALTSLPALSLVTDLSNLININGSRGIYSNPDGRGFAWERPASVEWINPPDSNAPNGTSEFQVDAGLRIRGGYSRATSNPKHSFRLFFRSDYGDSKLNYPLFSRKGAQSFDQIDLRTAQNYSWSFGGDLTNTFLREEASRQAMLDMGHPGSRVRYFHLYLNGQYWGLYNLDERTEADFAESYLGGASDEWDVVKCETTADGNVEPTDGNLDTWLDLWNKSKAHRSNPTNANYFRMMGRAADGVTATSDPVLLDPVNLADYLLLTFWTGNLDGCTSKFFNNVRANNWFGSRRRIGNTGQGFRFFVHDFEHTFFDVNENRTGPFQVANESNFAYSNPLFLHQDLVGNVEYRMLWADRIHKHLFNNGALTPTAWQNRINAFGAIVDQSIIAESARWGDAKVHPPRTRDTWINAQNEVLDYLPLRAPVILNQLVADGLYPAIAAPVVTPFGGYQESGVQLAISSPSAANLYYMPDGSDPRAVGGAIRSGALSYTASSTTEPLIPFSASGWRYLSNGSNLGTAWRNISFSDTTWPTGTAELGYGDGDETTSVGSFSNPKPATCYFRRNFDVTNPGTITNLSLLVEYDDAYAVYLNGTRVAGNLPTDPAYNYYTAQSVEDTQASTQIPITALVSGSNLIAVEVHQAASNSSDLSMNLSLTATRSQLPLTINLPGSGERTFRIRAYNGSIWSAMSDSTFLLDTDPASTSNLAITEIHYHPADPSSAEIAAGFNNSDDFEFIELQNMGPRHIDLEGVFFLGAISFDFTGAATGRTLAPGARILVVENRDAFVFRYGGGLPIAGQYTGNLNNGGENLTLYTPAETVVRSVTYDDAPPWPSAADGNGRSLIRRHPADSTGDSLAEGWAVSGEIGGSPGMVGIAASGTYDAWAAAHFNPSELELATTSSPLADPDGDDRTNVIEYAFATDPLSGDQPEARFVWSSIGGINHPAVSVRRPAGALDIIYGLEGSESPNGPWLEIGGTPAAITSLGNGVEDAVFRDPLPPSTPCRFYRIHAVWIP